jgi:hypothetical protein
MIFDFPAIVCWAKFFNTRFSHCILTLGLG